jgi:hypothetical protein
VLSGRKSKSYEHKIDLIYMRAIITAADLAADDSIYSLALRCFTLAVHMLALTKAV